MGAAGTHGRGREVTGGEQIAERPPGRPARTVNFETCHEDATAIRHPCTESCRLPWWPVFRSSARQRPG
ncbi:hypothetical protein GCM10010327_62700 [Streptomyces nitrosporeus]|nr:hypothetical protein GCM10010327_62700 [Streptomyces nitrosporeus]